MWSLSLFDISRGDLDDDGISDELGNRLPMVLYASAIGKALLSTSDESLSGGS